MNQITLFKFELPTLYARGERGDVLTWDIEIDGNKYRTLSGQINGKKNTSAWSIAEPKNIGQKNATTDEQQAQAEAEAKWKKKLKSGGYWEDIKDIDKASRYIEPMLAQKLRDHPEKVVFPCMVDKKYNGGRIVASVTGLFSRKGEQYASIPHIVEALAPLFEKHPNLVLDGEGYNHDLRFKLNELMSILRTTKASKITQDLLNQSERIVRLYVYDGYGFDNITEKTGNLERRKALKELLKNIPYVVWVPFRMAKDINEVNVIYNEDVQDGYEGAMIRNCNAPYEHKRSYNLLKVKPVDDAEFIIVKITDPGSGNWGGTGKIITFRMKDGKEFDGTFKGSMDAARQFLKDKDKWIGQKVTVHYNGLTGLGTPNYAQLDINNCLSGDK